MKITICCVFLGLLIARFLLFKKHIQIYSVISNQPMLSKIFWSYWERSLNFWEWDRSKKMKILKNFMKKNCISISYQFISSSNIVEKIKEDTWWVFDLYIYSNRRFLRSNETNGTNVPLVFCGSPIDDLEFMITFPGYNLNYCYLCIFDSINMDVYGFWWIPHLKKYNAPKAAFRKWRENLFE